jgi:hypothetical protein
MSEWWTYSLTDFLMFSPRTYHRLVELYNRDVWPAHAMALALGACLWPLARRGDAWAGRVIAVVLAAAWLWVAWAFHWQRYATINWAANYFAIGFAIEGLLLIGLGLMAGRLRFDATHNIGAHIGTGLLVFGLLIHPLTSQMLPGRTWAHAEVFGLMPDPSAVVTLGVLLHSRTRAARILMFIPLLWCLIAAATWWAMTQI